MSSTAYQKLSPYYHGFKAWVSKYPAVYNHLSTLRRLFKYTYPQSALAHQYLDGLRGLEIGASAFNPFGLDTLNLNCDPADYNFGKYEQELVGQSVAVGLMALGDQLPFADGQWDFVLTSHVLEHFLDPIKALNEWYRVIKPGGYLFLIVPHKDRTFDKHRSRTTLDELLARHAAHVVNTPSEHHLCVWIL
ncbi:MAG: class I SAM-dependent methyltransferase, partial [Pseudomonadota bacterium]|nr:class I SAM-dependent methyltransferase [Pseudomonadota bacterium]